MSREKEKFMIKLCAFADEAATSLEGQIASLKRNGIRYLELRAVNGTGVANITLKEAEEYARVLKENGIKVYSIGSPIGKVDIDVDFDKYLEEITHIFRLAKIFGTTRIRMFSFFKAYDKRELVISYLSRLVEKAKEYGVELYHENEKDIYGDTVDRVIDILESVPGLKSVYDPANFVHVGEKSDAALNLLHAKADYFHIKDAVSETGELVPAGHGDGAIDELLRRIEGDKVLTLEPHLAIFDSFKQIDNSEMKLRFHFTSNEEAFDAGVNALKELLIKAGYAENEWGYEKI